MERKLKDALFGCAQVLCAAVAMFTVLSLFASVFLLAELAVHFKVFYFLGASVSFAVFAMCRKWCWLIGASVLVAFHTPGLAVWYLPADRVAADELGTPLRVVTANVLVLNSRHDLFLAFVREANPDLVFIQELDESWARSLEVLHETYPYHVVKPQPDPFGIALFSRLPLDRIEIFYYDEPDIPAARAELTVNGRHVSILSFHTWPPRDRERLAIRERALAYLAQYASDAEDLVIVAGDLNVTPWAPSYRTLVRDSGLKNARQGYGIQPTWSNIPSSPSVLPLDHVLVSPEIGVTEFRVGRRIGSDHRPLVVDLRIPAKALE